MIDIDGDAARAKVEGAYREEFLLRFESFVLKTAYKTTNQYITKSDDVWSIAFLAFNEAIDSYDPEKGSFISFSEMIIRRRLYDHIRRKSRQAPELLVDPISFNGETDMEEGSTAYSRQVMDKTVSEPDDSTKWEIEAISQVLDNYGIRFMDLISVSPKAKKTKAACAQAVICLMDHPYLMERMKSFKLLPITEIEKNTKVPRKILERHRKYIIAAAEILSGDYPVLRTYIAYINLYRRSCNNK